MRPPDAQSALVSIIIPTYQRPANLGNAIGSVLAQSHKNIELIVIDDNPPDSEHRRQTAAVVSAYTHLPRFKYCKHSHNRNGAAARNTGIRLAQGKYLGFLDDDDIYYPDKIRNSLETLANSGPEYGAVYCGYMGWNSKTNDLSRYPEGDLSLAILMLNYSSHYMHTGSLLFRRKAIDRLGGFDEAFARHQDLELLLRFFQHFKVKALPQIQFEIRPKSAPRNFVFNKNFLDIKVQFLTKFKTNIEALDPDLSSRVYATQFANAIRQALSQHTKVVLREYIQKFPRFYREGLQQALVEHPRR